MESWTIKALRKKMTDTKDKLNEAKYFLTCMKVTRSEEDIFRYYVSAFLAAVDSVVDIMGTEFCQSHEFPKWWSQKKEEIGSEYDYFHEQRNRTLHVRALKATSTIRINVSQGIGVSETLKLVVPGTASMLKTELHSYVSTQQESGSTIDSDWFFEDRDKEPIVSLCEAYLGRLESIVGECESKFTPRPTKDIK